MKLRNLKIALAFIPNLLQPTGLFMSGDISVIGLKPPQGDIVSYSIPSDKKGSSIVLNGDTANPFYLYINKNKTDFENKMNPPAREEDIESLRLISITDKKLLAILHHLLTVEVPRRRFKLQDTLQILELLDSAILLRTGQKSKYAFPTSKWVEIKDEIEELVITKQIQLKKSNASITPVKSNVDYISDSN